ncbi:MAG: hypothetical protein GY803_15830 [Chloroflexi bacterium]|nr:hypothetical protein [Chloroflexota bacterium]
MRIKQIAVSIIFPILTSLALLLLIVGCNAATDEENVLVAPENGKNDEHDADADHDSAAQQFVPNDGAEVRITSPADGASFKSDANIPITIETTNFTIGEEGNHWHIYLEDKAIMVMGGETFVLQNLAPGDHEIDVYLSLGTHEDLENGDKIRIIVEE